MNARVLVVAALGGLVLIGAVLLVGGGDDGPGEVGRVVTEGVDETGRTDQSGAGGESGDAVAERVADALVPTGDTAGASPRVGSGSQPSAAQASANVGGGAPANRDGSPGAAQSGDPTPSRDAGNPSPSRDAAGATASADRPAVAADSIEAILRATARRYEGVRAMQADFEQQLTNSLLGRTTHSAGTLYQRQPDRFLMRFSDPAGDMIVSDGDYFWLYYPSVDPKQVIRSARGAGGLDLRSQFVGDPVRRFEATSQGGETVRGRATHVLTLVPREPAGYRRLKVWVDAEDHLVRRFELTEDNGNVRRFELTDLRINPTLEDALFEFEPPAGAVVVTRG